MLPRDFHFGLAASKSIHPAGSHEDVESLFLYLNISNRPPGRDRQTLSGTNPSRYGITSGVGVETRKRWLTVSPAFRFTRWPADPVGDMDSPHTYTVRNQLELLVGFSF